MKLLCTIFLIIVFTTRCISQSEKTKTFTFNNDNIDYLRVDYSRYGIRSFYVTMYDDAPQNIDINKKATACLKKIDRLYHTLYFFLKVPANITDQAKKDELLAEFLKHLVEEEKMIDFYLSLNFDSNYYIPFQENVRRVTRDVTSKNICDYLIR